MGKKQTCNLFALLMLVLAATSASSQIYTDLYNFGTNSGDPQHPSWSGILAQGRDGNLDSTSQAGGRGMARSFNLHQQGR